MDAITSPGPGRLPSNLWQELADQLPQLAWITDASGHALWFNKRALDYMGLSLDEVTGDGWTAAIHPDVLPEVAAAWRQAVETQSSYECHYPLRGHDGQWRNYLARAEPHRAPDGTVDFWFGTSTDVTDQVAAERHNHYLLRLEEVLRAANGVAEAQLAVIRHLGEELKASRVFFTHPDRERREAHVSEEYLAPGVVSLSGVHQFSDPVFSLYSRGEPVVLPDYREHPAFAADQQNSAISELPFRAVLDVPLVREGVLVSVLTVHQDERREWSADEVALAAATAERSWALIERVKAEEKARAAAEELQAVYATAPIGLTVIDSDLRYVRINERLAEINGFSPEEHLGKTIRELVPALADQAEETLKRVLGGEEIWGLELSGETPAHPGRLRTWRENWLPIRSKTGEITGVAISAEEVTSQKAAEVALARSEAQFRTLAEALPGMLFITTADGANSYVNETFARFSGLPKQELLGQGWTQLLHPDDRERTWAEWRSAKEEGRPYEVEYRLRNHEGAYRWVAARAMRVPEVDSEGRDMWVGTCIDIHATKVGEQELRESEARVRIATEHAEVGFWDVDVVNDVLIWPPVVKSMFGISADVPVSMQDFYEGLHPDDRERTSAAFAAAADPDQRAVYDVDYRTIGKEDGILRWIAAKGRGLFDGSGRCVRVLGTAIDITARKHAEQAVLRSEERFRALFESMEQGFCTIQVSFDEDGRPSNYRFTELNPAFSRHTGLSQDVLNKNVREAVPDLEEAWFERYGAVASSGVSQRFVDHAEPLGRWFENYAFPIGDPAEHTVAILFSDVTDRIEQEEALRRSEQELRFRLNAIPQMVWSTLPDGYHDFYNDRWYEFTGVPDGSTDGEAWNDVFHPEDQPLSRKRWARSLESGEPYEIEYRLRHHSGAYRWVLGRALPIRNEAGEIVRWMGTCTDIDDRIEADRALKASEARLRAILEAVPVGLIFSDQGGRLTGSNHQALEFLGHDLVESAAIDSYGNDYVAFHGDGRRVEGEEYPLARALRGEARPELECQVQRGDGSLRWLRYVAAPIRDAEGDIQGGVVASIDVDRERRLTQELEHEVEKVVAEREAAQEALRQSQKLESMGQLTGGVAHDFNNLLTPIIGSLDLLQRKQILDERTGRLVDGALASAEKARVLVQRLLAFARRQPLKPQAIDLKRVVSEMSDLVDSTSGPRIRVVTDLPADLPPAMADGNQLEMALLNLSVNARDAMPQGGTLSIAARAEQAAAGSRLGLAQKPHVVLAVSDTGVGMDEETRRRAIEPFFSTKGLGKGTGLGLSMVHGLAAQLGGALDIRSAPGVGTTIELWLPLATADVSDKSDLAGVAEPHGAGTVLLVDDEELVRASTASMLADLGYRVVEAESGEAALVLMKGGLRPSLLVTDQLMPGLSGTDLAVRVREQLEALPVLIVSGYADLESLSPVFPHLSKPFRQAELAAALEKVTT